MRKTWTKVLLALTLGVGVASCQPVALLRPAVVSRVAGITGRVTDLASARRAEATIDDVRKGATVSLIDTTTGQTVGTTVTDAYGVFSLNFGSGFKPGSQPYYMEAVKGLPVGGRANRAGASVARVRTILYFSSGGNGWTSLTGTIPGAPVNIGTATTALCDIVSLRGLAATPFVGAINGTTFTPPTGSAVSPTEFSTVLGLAGSLLAADEDPVEAVAYDSTLAQPYFSKPGNLVIFDNYSVNGVTNAPAGLSAPINQVVFNGQNFPSTASVMIGQLPVATWSVNPARTQLTVTLSANAYGGSLVVQSGQSSWVGPYLGVHGTVGTLSGSGNQAYVDGKGPLASLYTPAGLTFDRVAGLILGDFITIRKISLQGSVTTLAGSGYGYLDGLGSAAQFKNTNGLCQDAVGNTYVADWYNNRIRMVTPSGVVSTFAGTGTAAWADGTTASAQFNNPEGMAIDSSGAFYVTDQSDQTIRKIVGGTVTTLAGSPSVSGFTNGTNSGATFNSPTGIAVDAAGNVYVGDANNNAIRRISSTGVVTTYAGTGAYGRSDGPASSATFNRPRGLALDAAGNLYVMDSGNDEIRLISPGGTVSTIAGSGTAGFLDGPALSAQFQLDSSVGIGVDASGSVYIADGKNARVRVYTP